MRRLGKLLIPVVAAATLAGCASDPVTWADGFCGALVTLGTSVGPAPSDALTDAAVRRTEMITWADRAIAGTDRAVHDLEQLGTAPDPAAEQATARMTDGLHAMRAAFVDAKSIAEQADGANPAAFEKSYQQIVERLAALPDPAQNPFAGVPGSAAVADAATKAPRCQVPADAAPPSPAPQPGENP